MLGTVNGELSKDDNIKLGPLTISIDIDNSPFTVPSIILAKKVIDRVVGETGQFTLGLMNIAVVRNAFGR
jgi:hypothetical protein